ncbi:MAG: MATE family efflux transporter [Oscillospiraceae bacterium]|nr:MATE family efflux transporter [Oscillospiraceae bacterium]
MDILQNPLLDRTLWSKLRILMIPIALQNLINFGAKAADTLMVGMLGEIQLSAAAIANQVTFTYIVIGFGVASGAGVLAAQHWGAGNKQKVREIFAFMCRIVAVLSIFFAGISFFAPEQVMRIVITDPEVIYEGVIYLRWLALGFLFMGFTVAVISMLRSTGTVKIAVVVSLAMLVISIFLNYVLIFGNFGFPAMGIAGAGIATSVARIIEFVILVVYLFKIEKRVGLKIRDLFRPTPGIGQSYLRHGAPVLVNEIAWAGSAFMLGVIIGRMGREFVAANSIGGLLIQFVGIITFGVAAAAATVIGNTIGEGDQARAQQYAKALMMFSFLSGVAGLLVVQAVRLPLIDFYDLSYRAETYARQITHVISINTIFLSMAAINMIGTLRGGGDARFVMIIDVSFPWLISIPLGALAGPILGWPVWIVFLILRSEDIFKTLVVLWRIPRGKWIKDVTKT